MSRARSTGVWGALGGENLLICGPFAGLGLVRGIELLVRKGGPCCDGARIVSTPREANCHHRELLALPAKTERPRSRVSVIFQPPERR